jgi:hypothetical protein
MRVVSLCAELRTLAVIVELSLAGRTVAKVDRWLLQTCAIARCQIESMAGKDPATRDCDASAAFARAKRCTRD